MFELLLQNDMLWLALFDASWWKMEPLTACSGRVCILSHETANSELERTRGIRLFN